uniref:RNA/RNP complex-1-interacting phosphatase n=1 Tax=Apteryx owenii TaxID=8824 RepID=A0A8B9QCA0_APTOW
MGHEIPNNQTIYQFKCVVKNFLRDNKDNDKLIGVHCTHGLNRTGYLVCRYLIDVDGMEPNAAIELFNRARGHPIERMNYIEDLRKRSVKKNCSVKRLGSDPFKGKVGATPNTKRQLVAEHHLHHSEQFPLAMPRLLPSQQRRQGNGECRNSDYAKNSRRDKARVRRQELVHEHSAAKKRRPCSLGSRNCPVSLPYGEQYDGLCFPAQGPGFHLPQETHTAKKRRRRRRKPVTA